MNLVVAISLWVVVNCVRDGTGRRGDRAGDNLESGLLQPNNTIDCFEETALYARSAQKHKKIWPAVALLSRTVIHTITHVYH